ncbi:MAG: DnaJ domain-containing protein [Deltaproteobacteria bacterium]|nr:DnaJ domain-containing protein [Deltaproteobacteria bacterium]
MAEPPEAPEDADADIALAPEYRAYVLEVFPILANLDFYQLLGLARGDDKQAVKRAYFKLARVIHPDRYYGKQLGSYKAKLDAIFTRISRAYEVLSSDSMRADYDAQLAVIDRDPRRAQVRAAAPAPALPVAPQAAPSKPDPRQAGTTPASSAAEAAAAARKQAVFEALRQRVQQAPVNAAKHAEAAARARAAGDVTAALESYQRALALTPDDARLRAAHDEMVALVAERKCDAHRRQAALAEQQQRWDQAVASWRIVTEARPGDAEAHARLAAALARAAGRRS